MVRYGPVGRSFLRGWLLTNEFPHYARCELLACIVQHAEESVFTICLVLVIPLFRMADNLLRLIGLNSEQ